MTRDPETLAERFIPILHEDERLLGILPPDKEPRATQYIPEIIELIEQLIENGGPSSKAKYSLLTDGELETVPRGFSTFLE